MIMEKEVGIRQMTNRNLLSGWYKSSERAKHPHPKKLKVECSLDEDVVRWLERQTREDEEFAIYINHHLRKIIDDDISDCPELTDWQLSRLKPRYPENFKRRQVAF